MIYLILVIILIIFLILYLVFVRKLRIKWKTFLHKGFIPNRSNFGLYTYTGNQGKGKTYSLIEYIFDNRNNSFYFTNIDNIRCINYLSDLSNSLDSVNGVYFNGFSGLIQCKKDFDNGLYDELIKSKQVVFVFDELFTELSRNSQLSLQIQDFLCQLRKRKIIFLTTCQVWAELPLYLRRLCRFQINCNMFPFGTTGFIIKEFNDAENMKWNQDLQEHIAPTIELSFSKVRKKISECYDTNSRITNDKLNDS